MLEFVELFFSAHLERIFFLFVIVTVASAALWDYRNRNFPPGPASLPFVGYLPFLDSRAPYRKLTSLTKEFGQVFGVQLGSIYTVVVADAKLIKQTLTSQAFKNGTPPYLSNGFRSEESSSTMEEEHAEEFQDLNNAVKSLHGQLPKEIVESRIQESVRDFLQDIRSRMGEEQDFAPALKHVVGKLVADIVVGKGFCSTEAEWSAIQSAFVETSKTNNVTSAINFIPILRRTPIYSNGIQKLISKRELCKHIYGRFLEGRRKSTSFPEAPECFLDAYLDEMRKDAVVPLKDEILSETLLDAVNEEWERTLTTLKWLYLYMALYPEIQENVAREVRKVVGTNREAELEDLQRLPYTEATVLEILRHRTILPLGLPRAVQSETKIGDYIVPSKTMVIPLLWAVNHDSRLWEKPEAFSPERFVYEDGCVFRNENLLPLPKGNRAVLDDSFSHWTACIFLANTLNQFHIQFPNGYVYNVDEGFEFGSTLVPKPYRLQLQTRYK